MNGSCLNYHNKNPHKPLASKQSGSDGTRSYFTGIFLSANFIFKFEIWALINASEGKVCYY
jgi:hypothetical protein